MQMLKHCLNWKVIAALAVLGVGIYAVAPNLVAAALPILLLAICPLSMLFMMKGMQGDGGERRVSGQVGTDATREEELARLRAQQVALADQIGALERDEPQRVRDGKVR